MAVSQAEEDLITKIKLQGNKWFINENYQSSIVYHTDLLSQLTIQREIDWGTTDQCIKNTAYQAFYTQDGICMMMNNHNKAIKHIDIIINVG